MDRIMEAFAKKKTQWKEDLYFTIKLVHQKLSKNDAEDTSTTSTLLILPYIFNPFQNLRWFRNWVKGMDINPENETSYTTQYHKACLK